LLRVTLFNLGGNSGNAILNFNNAGHDVDDESRRWSPPLLILIKALPGYFTYSGATINISS